MNKDPIPEKFQLKMPDGKIIDTRCTFMINDRYISEMFFVQIPREFSEGLGGDVTGMLFRPKPEIPNEWVIQFRFRWYKEEKVWESKDTRSWYYLPFEKPTEEEALQFGVEQILGILQKCAGIMGHTKPLKMERMKIGGSEEAFFAAIERDKPYWMHMQTKIAE